jgi:DNA-directed RNA polymerase specialized sigma24 family protein
MVPKGAPKVNLQTRRQAQRRLRPAETQELAAAYLEGHTVYELAHQFRIHRDTVSKLLDRAEVPRRDRSVQGDLRDRVIKAYEDGVSLAAIGAEIDRSPTTVRRVLTEAGVTLRPRPGWEPTRSSGQSNPV